MTKREYDAAKARYMTWTAEQHQDPTDDMLADVALINAYERALNEASDGRAAAPHA